MKYCGSRRRPGTEKIEPTTSDEIIIYLVMDGVKTNILVILALIIIQI